MRYSTRYSRVSLDREHPVQLSKQERSREVRSYLLTQEEMKKLFRVTKRTIQRWTQKKLIPSVRVGGTTRYDIDDVRVILGMSRQDIDSVLNEEMFQ